MMGAIARGAPRALPHGNDRTCAWLLHAAPWRATEGHAAVLQRSIHASVPEPTND